MQRRKFLQHLSTTSILLGAGSFPLQAFANEDLVKLTILHTNDVHSRMDPFPMDGTRMQGLGGVAKRAALLRKIRKTTDNVLLLDAGDIFQGTPYFNFFDGEVEFKAMNKMGYDAATIGNHDFDGGIENLASKIKMAKFEMLNCNYEVSNTPLHGMTKPYKIFRKGPLKIGVFGIGIEVNGLVPGKLIGDTRYNDPIVAANKIAKELKENHECHYIICLSHLGYKYTRGNRVSDIKLARMTSNIDLILGGHTHSFLDEPDIQKNVVGKKVWINQVGWAGVLLGRIDVTFAKLTKRKVVSHENTIIK